jgi:hypothetical protein
MAARHRRILNLMTATKGHSLNLMTATHDQILTDDGNTGESESAAYDYEYESESNDSGEDDMSTLRERAEEQWTWKRSPTSIPCGAGAAASLERLTFYVTSGLAVHPDERTIFLSTVHETRPRKEIMSTFPWTPISLVGSGHA